jgi:hippurate hydrolase
MPTVNRFADLHDEIAAWRRDIHSHPELGFGEHRTAGIVADKLKEFGVDEVVTGIAQTGVVGVIKGQGSGSGKVIGLRADMDALPIAETSGVDWSSTVEGKMHACGHDGHTAMLLGAAKYLAETRNFDGTVVLIFQPAEEGGGGGGVMVEEGMMDRFGIQEVYGMHNMPGLPVGQFAVRKGSMMAATDEFVIDIEGCGGHAARPHQTVDSTLVGAQMMQALQSIVSRNVDPVEHAVVSVTTFHAGDTFNVIPQTARLTGTIRTLKESVRDQIEGRLRTVVEHTAKAMGAEVQLDYRRNYPVLVNHDDQVDFAVSVAREIAGDDKVIPDAPPILGAEDFAYMLNARPGCFIFTGNGDTASVHHPAYDFNDEAIPTGCSYWVRLVESAMPAR